MTANQVKHSLSTIISELSKTSWLFLRDPAKDFTRKRKLCFQDVVFFCCLWKQKVLIVTVHRSESQEHRQNRLVRVLR